MQAFKRELNKYAVDFSIKKDTETQNYTVFFKGQDVDRVYKGLQKCVENFQKGSKKPIKGFTSKAGKPFDANLVLKEDKTVGFDFPPRK